MNWTSRLARARAELEQLFMLIVFCNLIGHSIPAPLHSMRLLPFILPGVRRWKRLGLRERDLYGIGKGRNIEGGGNL